MPFGNLTGSSPGLGIEEQGSHIGQEKLDPALDFLIEIRFEDTIEELPELPAAPEPLDIGLAQT